MEDWRIKDYKTLCYNLQNKIALGTANEQTINKEVSKIMKKEKCDELSALKRYKKQLEKQLLK